jgi:Trehalose-phosphatase/haloacid dehalogenase-like hydrolase
MKQRVDAILTDYDGTLVHTADAKNSQTNTVPKELKEILEKICSEIPVCIISTKDFEFLKNKVTTFARILSCMMGIETLVLRNPSSSPTIVEKRLLYAGLQVLQLKSKTLEAIAQEVGSCEEFSSMLIERKHTSDGILAGLTIDWRHLSCSDWSHYKRGITHFVSSMVANLNKPPAPLDIYIQKYSEHPFLDIYSIECNKGIAFDTVISELSYASAHGKGTLYVGDSENDNPAFRKAGISIGVRSDARLNPKLNCAYLLNYEQLSSFLTKLRNNDYLFDDDQLRVEEAKKHE